MDHRREEHEISSLGTSVEVGNQGDQALDPQQPENVGAAKPVEPTPEVCDPSDQTPKPLKQKEPKPKGPEVPTGGIGQQVEVDEVKGLEQRNITGNAKLATISLVATHIDVVI